MAHNKKFDDFMTAVVAVAPQTKTSTALEASSINATGYDRATFIFQMGAPTSASGYLSSGNLIWNASTSGATYTALTGGSFGTHITGGAASKANFIIDVNVNPSYPWLKVSASNCSSTGTYSVICVLRTPQDMPPDSLSGQIVTV
jgi:hypothetical protein